MQPVLAAVNLASYYQQQVCHKRPLIFKMMIEKILFSWTILPSREALH